MAVPGETTCREVATCGAGTWGEIAHETGAVYVDKEYRGGDSNGTREKPFTKIQDGVDAAVVDGLVALAEGQYLENVRIVKPLRLRGRCPARVEIRGIASEPAVLISVTGKATLSGVSLTGPSIGLQVKRGSVDVSEILAHDLGGRAVEVFGASAVSLRASLIEGNAEFGVAVFGAKATIERSVLRDTRPRSSDRKVGRGVDAEDAAEVIVRESVIERNHDAGIAVFGSKATVEASVVRDTAVRESDKAGGQGVHAEPDAGRPGEVVVRNALIERNRDTGIALLGVKATIEATTVRDTISRLSDGKFGRGIAAGVDPGTALRAELFVHGSLVERNQHGGIALSGSKAHIAATIVRETRPQLIDQLFGRGIDVASEKMVPAELLVEDSLIERNRDLGIAVFGSSARIEATVIRDTMPLSGERFGDGIAVIGSPFGSFPLGTAFLTLRAVRIDASARVGVVAFGNAEMDLAANLISCNGVDLAKVAGSDGGSTIAPVFDTSAGANACGCGSLELCKVEAKELAEIPVPGL